MACALIRCDARSAKAVKPPGQARWRESAQSFQNTGQPCHSLSRADAPQVLVGANEELAFAGDD